jgi:predicted Rossmann-fold nucleotide-binding protein
MPGGYGTMEELLEMITWNQLGIHRKPVGSNSQYKGLYNVCNFFDPLIEFLTNACNYGFIDQVFHPRDMLVISSDPEELVHKLVSFATPQRTEPYWNAEVDPNHLIWIKLNKESSTKTLYRWLFYQMHISDGLALR